MVLSDFDHAINQPSNGDNSKFSLNSEELEQLKKSKNEIKTLEDEWDSNVGKATDAEFDILDEKLAKARIKFKELIIIKDDELENLLNNKFTNKVECKVNKEKNLICITVFNTGSTDDLNRIMYDLIYVKTNAKQPKKKGYLFERYEDRVKVEVPLRYRDALIDALRALTNRLSSCGPMNTKK